MVKKPPPASPQQDAEWVLAIRKKANLTQPQFAEAVGHKLHRVTVTNWEAGKFPVSRDYVEAIMRRFPGTPPPPSMAGGEMSPPPAKVLPIQQALEAALERRAATLTGTQVVKLRKLVDNRVTRAKPGLQLGEGEADAFLEVLADLGGVVQKG